MNLRWHQAETLAIAKRIAAGESIRKILVSVTPGGGKSALPGILANVLIPSFADRILWVVPRNSLREQGEADFPEWSRYRIRAAGNEWDPCRGTRGYLTTYQAIVADPLRHMETLSQGRWIVFLDEPHHVALESRWNEELSHITKRSSLIVYASGTFARGDGRAIAGLDYGPDGLPLLEPRQGVDVVRYSRSDALREGAIVPVHFRHLDGRAEWEDVDGSHREASTLSGGDYAPAALFTALRTEYALELLDECVADWREYRKITYPSGKLLVVAPSIALAEVYLSHLHRRRIEALIATSDDSPAAAEAIARFKGRALPTTDVLITCQMAYEGMSVPAVSHIACLTHIRSVPWLEQCFARANRTAPGKREAFIYGPADARFKEAIAAIEAEQLQALTEQGEDGGDPSGDLEGEGGARPKIRPIGSAAYREGSLFADPEPSLAEKPDGGLTPSQAQALLRKEIARHIEAYLAGKRYGSKAVYQKIVMRKLKEIVGGKARGDCTVEELTRQLAWVKGNLK